MVQRYAKHMLLKNDTDFVNCLSVVVKSTSNTKNKTTVDELNQN